MATARLDVRTKERIISTVDGILDRLRWYPDPPLSELSGDGVKEFLKECTNPTSWQAIQTLLLECEKDLLFRAETYEPTVRTNILSYKTDGTPCVIGLAFNIKYLALSYHLPTRCEAEWEGWIREKMANAQKANSAHEFVEQVIKDSTSVGQLLRAMPFIRGYLPDSLVRSLGEAKRMSRMPACLAELHYAERQEKMKQLEESLAVAYLLKERSYQERYAFPQIRDLSINP